MLNPLAHALVSNGTFVARGFSGDMLHLKGLIVEAIKHRGFAFIDVFQPCVTFNYLNTYDWFRQRVYKLEEEGHDVTDRGKALEKAFESLETISIDYAVMEKAKEVRCVACQFSWSDIGGWMALREYLPQDGTENCYHGEIVTLDSKGNLVYCENTNETVMLVGANDLVIVRSGQKTLIAHKSRTEEMKKLVEAMQGN